jgi:hypothetical protein
MSTVRLGFFYNVCHSSGCRSNHKTLHPWKIVRHFCTTSTLSIPFPAELTSQVRTKPLLCTGESECASIVLDRREVS